MWCDHAVNKKLCYRKRRPRDAMCQSKVCQLLHNSVGTSCTTNPQQIEVMEKLKSYSHQRVINYVPVLCIYRASIASRGKKTKRTWRRWKRLKQNKCAVSMWADVGSSIVMKSPKYSPDCPVYITWSELNPTRVTNECKPRSHHTTLFLRPISTKSRSPWRDIGLCAWPITARCNWVGWFVSLVQFVRCERGLSDS